MNPFNLAVIPSEERGNLEMLRNIEWTQEAAHKSHHVVLVQTGLWYNLVPWCSSIGHRLSQTHTGIEQSELVCGHDANCFPVTWCPGSNQSLAWQPNHGNPDRTLPPHALSHKGKNKAPMWGWYARARRLAGTTTITEWGADVRTFLRAARRWQREFWQNARADVQAGQVPNPTAAVTRPLPMPSLLWIEATPQHFAKNPSDGCLMQGHPLLPSPDAALSPEARRLCEPYSPSGSDPRATLHGECLTRLHNWRNDIALPLVRAARVPVVSLFSSLDGHADFHPDFGKTGVDAGISADGSNMTMRDCTHWCAPSEASLKVAAEVLSRLEDLVLQRRRRADGGGESLEEV